LRVYASRTGYPAESWWPAHGRYVIAGHAEDHTRAIHLIDVESEQVADIVHAGAAVLDIAAEPHGTRFAAAAGQQVLVWTLPNQR
jgi:hypothetical protein